jgi:hypothetical protein
VDAENPTRILDPDQALAQNQACLNHAIAKNLVRLEAMKESRSYVQFIQDIH